MRQRHWPAVLMLAAGSTLAFAHVGSPDIYVDGNAGPYKLSVVIRPPSVIPGVAEVAVRSESDGIDGISVVPLPVSGEGAKRAPTSDNMTRNGNGAVYSANVWIMAAGSWQIKFVAHGAQGSGTLSVPFSAMATATRTMSAGLGSLLAVLTILLIAGAIGIVGACLREAHLRPGEMPTPELRRRGQLGMVFAAVVVTVCLVAGGRWWKSEALAHGRALYKPLQLDLSVTNGGRLSLGIHDPGWLSERRIDDFIPDHGHLMHLYMIRWPQMDVVYHLHPELETTGDFSLALPNLKPGNYRLYADVVHADGFAETLTGSFSSGANDGRPLTGDDAMGTAKPVGERSDQVIGNDVTFHLPDGYSMVWKMPTKLAPAEGEDFRFKLLDPQGKAPADMALYMGMVGHAAFLKTDGTVFAHIHPNGTVSMATFMMTNPEMQMDMGGETASALMPMMPGMQMARGRVPNTVEFPYGFPSAGNYRIFVQMKHGSVVETGVFDAMVP